MATDPVCGMEVDEKKSDIIYRHDGETFHFCSAKCREEFAESPDDYL